MATVARRAASAGGWRGGSMGVVDALRRLGWWASLRLRPTLAGRALQVRAPGLGVGFALQSWFWRFLGNGEANTVGGGRHNRDLAYTMYIKSCPKL